MGEVAWGIQMRFPDCSTVSTGGTPPPATDPLYGEHGPLVEQWLPRA
jgi:hypothetical protein